MKIIVDTGFLSSLAKINRLELITEFFDYEKFSVPTQAIDELKKSRNSSQNTSKTSWERLKTPTSICYTRNPYFSA